jgi:hypothetical protein
MNTCIADSFQNKTTSLRGQLNHNNLMNRIDCHTVFAMTICWGVFEMNPTNFNM